MLSIASPKPHQAHIWALMDVHEGQQAASLAEILLRAADGAGPVGVCELGAGWAPSELALHSLLEDQPSATLELGHTDDGPYVALVLHVGPTIWRWLD